MNIPLMLSILFAASLLQTGTGGELYQAPPPGSQTRWISPENPVMELVQEGRPSCSIVIAEKPGPAARLASLELQFHLWKISGAEIPIRSENEPVDGRRILVGESSATRQLNLHGKDFGPQEYLIAFRSDTIILMGRDWEDTEENRQVEGRPMVGASLQALRHKIDFWKAAGHPQRSIGEMELPGLYDDQGTCLAVYDFLERFCGVRWYGPAELNMVIPLRSTLSVAGGDIRRAPALKHRSALPAGNWPFLRGQWGQFTPEQVQLYWRRIRQGGVRWAGNHTFHRSTIQAVFNDPEYQSKNPKSQGSQLCYSHPKLVTQVAQMARDYFDGKDSLPEGWKALGDYFAIVPDDNMNLCNCPACTELLQKGTTRKTGFFSSGEISEYWFSFVNAVAREVRKTHPDKYVTTLAYWAYALPPSFHLEPNVSIAPCLHTCYYPVHAGMRENDLMFYRQWREKTSAPMFLWTYYHHPMEPALIDRWKCFPHVMVHETARSMQMFLRDGVQGVFECGEQDQLEQYVMAKVWDDPGVDVDGLIDEFFRLYFGAAEEPMKKFYLRLEQIACDPSNYPPPYLRKNGVDWKKAAWERLGTSERMEELGALISQAEQLAATATEKQRVGLWRSSLWEWMRQGRTQHLAAQNISSGPSNRDQTVPRLSFPDFATLAGGTKQVRLLPGHHEFVFSMYGAPGDLEKLRQLVGVMRDQELGNGFDPGPGIHPTSKPLFDYLATVGWPAVCYSGSEMQIKGGRAVLGRDHEIVLSAMDQAGLFSALQLGEWGYYFHNLAPHEPWWREVYGKEFDTFKHLMKPTGLAGYDRRPASRKECYEIVRDYFQSRQRDLLGRVISVTGHSHYEAYAAEWGARCIGLELGENIAFTQSKMAFARGASRQWGTPWSVQVSPWFSGACTTSGPLRQEGKDARGLDAGHSLSFYERMWLHSWFAGTAMVTPENSLAIFFEKAESPWTLTSHGRKAAEVFRFMRKHSRGIPYTPVAVVLDHLAGYNAYMDKPWGILNPTPGDREVRDLFDHQLFPGSDHIHVRPDPNNPESSYLRPTPFGEIFDVLLTSVPPEILPDYPVILLAGDMDFDHAFLSELEKALRRGSRVFMSSRHREALGEEFNRVARQGEVEVLESWTNPVTGRPAAISNDRLQSLANQCLPIHVAGDPVQYQINRIPKGWVVELINNQGVVKKPNQPAIVDSTAIAKIQLRSRVPCKAVKEWHSMRTHDQTALVQVELGPGAIEYVEFMEPGQ